MKMKSLLGKLNEVEARLLFDIPGILDGNLFFDALRAWRTETPIELLWARLRTLLRLESKPDMSPNLFYTLNGTIAYEIVESRLSIGNVKKYSGYVRNSSSVGSKRASKISIPEPESVEWTNNIEKDYFSYLTVGELPSFSESIIFTLTSSKKSETVFPFS